MYDLRVVRHMIRCHMWDIWYVNFSHITCDACEMSIYTCDNVSYIHVTTYHTHNVVTCVTCDNDTLSHVTHVTTYHTTHIAHMPCDAPLFRVSHVYIYIHILVPLHIWHAIQSWYLNPNDSYEIKKKHFKIDMLHASHVICVISHGMFKLLRDVTSYFVTWQCITCLTWHGC